MDQQAQRFFKLEIFSQILLWVAIGAVIAEVIMYSTVQLLDCKDAINNYTIM